MADPGDVVWLQFPGALTTKRRPAVIFSSAAYHSSRPDIIVGLITSQTAKATAPTDHLLADWSAAGLRVPSAFRAFLATLPRAAVISKVGRRAPADWQAVQARTRAALAL